MTERRTHTKEQRRAFAKREVRALLLENGINPLAVHYDNMDESGYREIVLNQQNQPVLAGFGQVLTIEREWPKGFPVDYFYECVTEMLS